MDKPRVLVTGTAGGIGSALVRELGSLGARIGISGRNEKSLQELKNETGVGFPPCEVPSFLCDLENPSQAGALGPRVAGFFLGGG